jgi:lipoate-protein ligase A
MKYLDLTLSTPAENVARDEQLLDAAERGDGGAALRVWESAQPFAVVGYSETFETEVDMAACKRRGIPVLRRCSGGGTVVQGPGCLSYALILEITEDGPLRNVTAANRFIMERNRAAIESLLGPGGANNSTPSPLPSPPFHGGEGENLSGQTIEVQGHTDLTLDGLKFSGNAQRRRKHWLLFHGTFLLNFDLALIGELLPMPSRQPDYRVSRPHGKFLTNLNLPADAVKAALKKTWMGMDF